MTPTRLLVVDDDETVRSSLGKILETSGFKVTSAGNVSEALKHISAQGYDALLSDLHMPGAGDGLTVVSAMRHANPEAVTLLLSAFPHMSAADAILKQADEILVKPMKITDLVEAITQRLGKGPLHPRKIESLASILERVTQESIDAWYDGILEEEVLTSVELSREDRCQHLPQLFLDLSRRLQAFKPLGTKELLSVAATDYGRLRRRQGYTAEMMVQESRILQVAIFQTLQKNLGTMDFSVLLFGVMTIADGVDFQLSQAMKSYIAESVEAAAA